MSDKLAELLGAHRLTIDPADNGYICLCGWWPPGGTVQEHDIHQAVVLRAHGVSYE